MLVQSWAKSAGNRQISVYVGWGFLLNLKRFIISAELFLFPPKEKETFTINHTQKILFATQLLNREMYVFHFVYQAYWYIFIYSINHYRSLSTWKWEPMGLSHCYEGSAVLWKPWKATHLKDLKIQCRVNLSHWPCGVPGAKPHPQDLNNFTKILKTKIKMVVEILTSVFQNVNKTRHPLPLD